MHAWQCSGTREREGLSSSLGQSINEVTHLRLAKHDDNMDRLREWDIDRGEGKNVKKLRDSIYGWSLSVLARHEILRGFFHRENRILLRKSQILDLDTILYSMYYVKKSLKNRTF